MSNGNRMGPNSPSGSMQGRSTWSARAQARARRGLRRTDSDIVASDAPHCKKGVMKGLQKGLLAPWIEIRLDKWQVEA